MVKVHSMAPIISAPLKLLLFLFQTVFCRCFLAHPLIMLRRLLTLWGIFGRHFADNILWTSSLFTSFFPLVLCIPHITSRSFLFPLCSWTRAWINQGLLEMYLQGHQQAASTWSGRNEQSQGIIMYGIYEHFSGWWYRQCLASLVKFSIFLVFPEINHYYSYQFLLVILNDEEEEKSSNWGFPASHHFQIMRFSSCWPPSQPTLVVVLHPQFQMEAFLLFSEHWSL